jgi:putative nucleotidyltransferase with HDIG domain
MTKEQALELLHKNMQNGNLRRHCYAVGVVMKSLAKRLGEEENQEKWEISGILHDADWEKTGTTPEEHTHHTIAWIREVEPDPELENAILSHGWNYVAGNPQPQTKMEWALYTCDELTGLIVATTLVRPDKKLASVTVDSVMDKWKQKSFAAGVNREQIAECEGRLGITVKEFVEIALQSMQSIAPQLGL